MKKSKEGLAAMHEFLYELTDPFEREKFKAVIMLMYSVNAQYAPKPNVNSADWRDGCLSGIRLFLDAVDTPEFLSIKRPKILQGLVFAMQKAIVENSHVL